jgi:hypothetical protein
MNFGENNPKILFTTPSQNQFTYGLQLKNKSTGEPQ